MIISLPDKYNIENSIENILSIRLNPGGLSFSLCNSKQPADYFFQEVIFDKSIPYITSLKDCFFENSFFSWSFRQANILSVSPVYTLIPSIFYRERIQEQFLSFNKSGLNGHGLVNQLSSPDAVLAFLMDEEIYEFCSRSFIHPYYSHYLTHLLPLWKKQSSAYLYMQMYVVFNHGFMDVACYSHGELLMINSFSCQQSNDALFYILYIWNQMGMDQLKDFLFYTGEADIQPQVISNLRTYLNNIQPMEVPSEAYLRGGYFLKAPLDLITLSIE